jgi:hypothetical protein
MAEFSRDGRKTLQRIIFTKVKLGMSTDPMDPYCAFPRKRTPRLTEQSFE